MGWLLRSFNLVLKTNSTLFEFHNCPLCKFYIVCTIISIRMDAFSDPCANHSVFIYLQKVFIESFKNYARDKLLRSHNGIKPIKFTHSVLFAKEF